MTMFVYTGFTIIYIGLIIVTLFSAIFNHKKNANMLGMGFNKLLTTTAITTVLYCFISYVAADEMKIIWTNFIFVICVVAAVIMSAFLCSGISKTFKEDFNSSSIENTLNGLNEKKQKINQQIALLQKNYTSQSTTEDSKRRTDAAIDELKSIQNKYDILINELVIQSALASAKKDNDAIDNLEIISNKTVKDKMDFNINKYDSGRALEDTLNDVRKLMKNYK